MVMLPDASAPPGMRLYAIGDIHGCTDLLVEMHQRIATDLEQRPIADWRVIHLGDYIDRGPDSAGTLGYLQDYSADQRADFLIGNHDRFILDFLSDPEDPSFDLWITNNGMTTIDSYGIEGRKILYSVGAGAVYRLHQALTDAVQPGMRDFLAGMSRMLIYGDYLFTHAGIRPGVELENQIDHDLTWIREPFLSCDDDLGFVVVHGHTPVDQVEVRPNRIDIDTGAVFSGTLTCLVLEAQEQALLEADAPVPLTLPFIDC